tara:strand:- start:2871 stop:3221 length:351 start_codon:yes stop_codon:yes gene_type:complete
MPKLEEFAAIDHPYYCSESNFYSNKPNFNCETMTEFLDAAEDWDVDMNLMFRWDIKKYESEDGDGYYAELFFILQRKGIFKPCSVEQVTEEELPRFLEFAKKHWSKMQEIWQPISK